MLIGVFEPSDLETMSLIPLNSTTARTGPPAITPVPAGAGLNNTLPPHKHCNRMRNSSIYNWNTN